jgi:tetratricopeptide (TPR) repeat protein
LLPKSSKDLLEEKLAMVYDYNHATPLFIRAANRELLIGQPHKALDILNQGIKLFPKYPTAFILLGKVHLGLGNFDLAEDAYRKGCELFSSEPTLSYYLSELESEKSKHPNITSSRRVSFFESNIIDEKLSKGDADDLLDKHENKDLKKSSIDDRLEDVAKEISLAKIDLSNEGNSEISFENVKKSENLPIISETLAKIYISQGKFKEAIEVYMKLQIKSPDKKDSYQAKIDEIKKQLGENAQ